MANNMSSETRMNGAAKNGSAVKICIANQKGGVGKSTTALAVSADLIKRGYRVLMIDTDPQRNSTKIYHAQTENCATLYDIMKSGYKASDCIQSTEYGDIIPSDELLVNADDEIKQGPNRYYLLRNALREIEQNYDFIIYDTPPHVGVLLGNALMSCSYVIMPCTCDAFGIQGILDFFETIKEYQTVNEELSILGLLIIKYKGRQSLTRDLEENLIPNYAATMNTKVFETRIRESVKCQEAQTLMMSLYDYAPNCTTATDYHELVDEILKGVN